MSPSRRFHCALIAALAVLATAAPARSASTTSLAPEREGHEVLVVDMDATAHDVVVEVLRREQIVNGETRFYRVLRLHDLGASDVRERVNIDVWWENYDGQTPLQPGASCLPTLSCHQDPAQTRGLILRLGAANDRVYITSEARRSLYMPEVWSGPGDDVLTVGSSGFTPVFLLGGDGNDSLIGSKNGREALFGGPGNDRITPGDMKADHVDGGHGDFAVDGRPMLRTYVANAGECAARTQGFWDRAVNVPPAGSTATGFDTLDLTRSSRGDETIASAHPLRDGTPTAGALADLNRCRLAYFAGNREFEPSLVHAIESVRGTRFNDRIVGDGTGTLIWGMAGQDWLSGERGGTVVARDGEPDTVKCFGAGSGNLNVVDRLDKQLLAVKGKPCANWQVG